MQGLAVYRQNQAFGLSSKEPLYPGDLEYLIATGNHALHDAYDILTTGSCVDLTAAEFLPPLQNSGKIICIGLNYADHAAESGFQAPSYPTVFARFNSSLVGHRIPIIRPAVSAQLDYEGELVAVIGLGGRNIPVDRALGHVIGYSIFNDASVRDYQFKSRQWTMGKNFDRTGAFGPMFVTADELPPGAKGLRIETRLNGEVVQSASTAQMIFDVANLVSILSEGMTLNPGDIIVTGTPSGVGWFRDPKLLMKPGDVCEVEIEQIGTLLNPIMQEVRQARPERVAMEANRIMEGGGAQ